MDLPAPVLLRADNFTPPTRTPWGGRKILDVIKRDHDLDEARNLSCVGESWEVSVEPSFPSRLARDNALLADVIAADPAAWLGQSALSSQVKQTSLLVKLLDTADNLSVQVHPADDDPSLADDESGKPEAWYVIDADPGSGLYLGFDDGVERADVEDCLRRGGRLDKLTNFVPVKKGDAFLLEAGTVHAIGAGVTLVESQLVRPGRRGVTYRYWDWNRRYDASGKPSPDGQLRPLHIEQSLAVTRWTAGRGARAVSECRASARTLLSGPLSRTEVIHWSHFIVEEWAGTGQLDIPAMGTFLAVLCIKGRATLTTESGNLSIERGQSAAVPAAAGASRLTGVDTSLLVSRCQP